MNKEKTLKTTYAKLMETGFGNLPIEEIHEFINKDVMGYGTAVDEKIMNLEEFSKLIVEQRKQSVNFDDFSFTSNPVKMQFVDDGNVALVVDEIELNTQIKNESHTLFLRMTSVFEFKGESWKLIHWHGSKPEHVSDGEDPWHIDEWKKKNAELEKAVEEKTLDLIQKNKELEIEAALERVRTVAMGMEKSDDLLKICEISFKEFKKLGFNGLRNAVIHIPNDEQKYFMDYDYSEFTGGDIAKIEYGSHHLVDEYLEKIKISKDAFFEVVIEKDQMKAWKEFRKNSGQSDDSRLDKADELYYYLFSIGIGDIGISTFKPIIDSQIKILKRFRNVFDLAYKRYNDIALAEAQAKEAQIQLALERVRARAMAMHKSDELVEVALLLRKEMGLLGIEELETSSIYVHNEKLGETECWFSIQDRENEKKLISDHMTINLKDTWVGRQMLKFFDSGKERTSVVMKGAKRVEWITYCADKSELFSAEGFYGDKIPERTYHLYKFSQGYIGAAAPGEISKESWDVLKRATSVFSIAYTRFSDLKKAESQAREAQIEAALEKVRSRSLAMQSANELGDVVKVIVEKLQELNVVLDANGVVLCTYFQDSKNVLHWIASPDFSFVGSYLLPYFDHPIFNDAWKSKESGDEYFSKEFSVGEKNSFFEYAFEHSDYKKFPKEFKEWVFQNDRHILSFAWQKNSAILIPSHTGIVPLEDEVEILKRFAKVFEQTYIRFLDLQKAEAQTREAQIEAGLERARAQSMMMQHSEELNKTSQVFHEQLRILGIDSEFSYLWLPDEERDEHLFWATWREMNEGTVSFKNKQVIYPLDKSEPAIAECYVAWESGMPVHVNPVPATGVEAYFNTWTELLEGVDKFKPELYPDGLYYVDAYMKYGCFGIMIRNQLSEDEQKVLHRFSKEFERTFTRFLDLKKAEAQAREAKIEASLERVRSKAMAMSSSEDLTKNADIFFAELNKLNINPHRCGFGIVDRENRIADVHATTATQDKSLKILTGKLKLYGHPVLEKIFEGYEKQEEYHPVLRGKEISEYYEVMNPQIEFPEFSDDEIQYGYYFYFREGGVFAWTDKKFAENELEIFRRYSSVLSLTYRRYFDLKEAEAQTRESQIELSLERIRAQVTAMKESAELLDIVVTMRTEFINLGHEAHYFWHMRYLPNKYEKAMTSGDGTRIGMVMTLPRHIHGDIKLLADWEKSDEPTVVFAMDVETAVDYVDKMISLGDFQQLDPNSPTLDDIRHIGGLTFVMARTSHGEIGYSLPGVVPDPPAEDLAILFRFAGVFDLAYKRFEDLKSSEQRNREAKIELALERVRARTMAMQKSNELAQTSSYLFTQLNELGIKPYRCNIAIVDEELANCSLWSTTNSGNVILAGSALALDEFPVLKEMYVGWKTQRPDHVIKLEGKPRLEWTKYICKYVPFDEYKKENLDENEILNNAVYFYNFYFKQGFFTIHSKEELEENHLQVIQRFAYVFEQTYTRFQDLENAEKQNKIIQAENERKTEELEEARQLQLAMLPKELPQISNLDIAVFMKTATEVGGDYYDFHVDSKNNLTAIIGDATGHGMKAGTMVTITKSLFNSLASSRDILKTFKRISEVIKNMKFRQLSMCLQMIKINGSEFSISSAAMPPAFIYRFEEESVEEILLSGMPLGAMLNYKYKIEKRNLKSGDVIFLLSDGLPELHNHQKHMYGYDRVKTELKIIGKKSPQEIVAHFEQSANEWLNGHEQDDDVTFVVIKIK